MAPTMEVQTARLPAGRSTSSQCVVMLTPCRETQRPGTPPPAHNSTALPRRPSDLRRRTCGDVRHQRQVLDQAAALPLRRVRRAHHAPLAGVQGAGAGHLARLLELRGHARHHAQRGDERQPRQDLRVGGPSATRGGACAVRHCWGHEGCDLVFMGQACHGVCEAGAVPSEPQASHARSCLGPHELAGLTTATRAEHCSECQPLTRFSHQTHG